MSVRILEADGKPVFAVLSYDEYQALRELADDAEDTAALVRFAKRYAAGKEKTVPAAVVDRLLAGETPLRVWREHRGMTAAQLAAALDITPAHVSKLESGKGDPSVAVLRRLAKLLQVSLEDIVGVDSLMITAIVPRTSKRPVKISLFLKIGEITIS